MLSAFTANACGGLDQGPSQWLVERRQYSGELGLPFLSPANDSRLNLRLLMLDVRPPASATAQPAIPNADINSSPLFTLKEFAATIDPKATPSKADTEVIIWGTVFADEEGSRCASDEAGRTTFSEMVRAEPSLSQDEQGILIKSREAIATNCPAPLAEASGPLPAPPPPVGTSDAAREFNGYIAGVKAFYDGNFDLARASFLPLANAKNAKLRETALYMNARALLNKAEIGAFAGFDGLPEPKVTDRISLDGAEAALRDYLGAYSTGRYAASARGLLRRVYWLAGDRTRLAAEYGWQIAHAGEAQANLDAGSLAQEIDSKLFEAPLTAIHDPFMLAVGDLMRMRSSPAVKSTLAAAELDSQAADFAGHEALLAYLKAAQAYYVAGDPAATLALLGSDAAAPTSYLAFSREALRGEALMAAGRWPESIDHWRKLRSTASLPWQPEAADLGLAESLERSGAVNGAFAGDTRVASSRLRAILLRYVAGPILLRQAIIDPQSTAEEKALARFVLLFKEATHGHYSGFLRDYSPEALKNETQPPGQMKPNVFLWSGSKDPYACPGLKAVMEELASNPKASHGLICLTEFARLTALDGFEDSHPQPEELGGGKSIFPGEAFSRGEVYKAVVADPAAAENDKAYALYRLVNCYAPAAINECSGKSVDLPQRKAWFRLLKTKYAATPWAQSLTYYW